MPIDGVRDNSKDITELNTKMDSVKSELNTKMDDNKKQILGAIRDMRDEMREDIKAIGDRSIRNEADIKSLKERKD